MTEALSSLYICARSKTHEHMQNGRIHSLHNTFVIPCSKILAGTRIRPSHLERELRVVRRLDGDVQHGGQHCGKPARVPSVPHNRINIIRRTQNKHR
jgi:hypothetical protein